MREKDHLRLFKIALTLSLGLALSIAMLLVHGQVTRIENHPVQIPSPRLEIPSSPRFEGIGPRPLARFEEKPNDLLKHALSEIKTTPRGDRGKLVPALLAAISREEAEELRGNFSSLTLPAQLVDPSAITALVDALATKNSGNAALVLLGMRRMDGFAFTGSDINGLANAFSIGDAILRADLATLLGACAHSNDHRVLDVLVKALSGDKDAKVRSAAAAALAEIGQESYSKTAELAAMALGDALTKDDSNAVRSAAAQSLYELSAKARPAAGAIVKSLGDNDSQVRTYSLFALPSLGASAANAIPELVAILKRGDDDEASFRACNAVESIGPAASSAVPALLELLKNERLRNSAARALGKIGPAASPAVPALIQLLKSANYDDRECAAYGLGGIGKAATVALPALEKAITDERNSQGAGNPGSAQEAAGMAVSRVKGD